MAAEAGYLATPAGILRDNGSIPRVCVGLDGWFLVRARLFSMVFSVHSTPDFYDLVMWGSAPLPFIFTLNLQLQYKWTAGIDTVVTHEKKRDQDPFTKNSIQDFTIMPFTVDLENMIQPYKS